MESPALPVMEGDTVTLRCRKKATSINLTYFYKDDVLMAKNHAEELTIKNVSKSYEGIYKCSISDAGASPGSWLAVRGDTVLRNKDYIKIACRELVQN